MQLLFTKETMPQLQVFLRKIGFALSLDRRHVLVVLGQGCVDLAAIAATLRCSPGASRGIPGLFPRLRENGEPGIHFL